MVTEHQQLQLWIELHVPLFHAVTAVVYFTLKEKRHIQQHITTNSVLTENTMMVFQLESHEIPEKFQKEDFLVQVALRVGTKEGSVVPRNLEEASTSSKYYCNSACSCEGAIIIVKTYKCVVLPV